MSIKICVITPISHLGVFGALGEMDMSLAHLVLENGGDNPYAKYYKQQGEKGRFVILDNGLYELQQRGVGAGIDATLDAAEIINPSEIIAEDVLFDGTATIESTKRFIARMKERKVFGKYKVMAVAQGKTEQEWWDCFSRLLYLPDVDTIGLSKLAVPQSFLGERESSGCVARSRLICTRQIAQGLSVPRSIYPLIGPNGEQVESIGCSLAYGKVLHLLGGDNWTPWEMQQQKRYPWIRSNDSSAAVWYGKYHRVFSEEGKIEDIITEKPDLENKDWYTEQRLATPEVQTLILKNIIHWHMACKS